MRALARRALLAAAIVGSLPVSTLAQSSASYKLNEQVFNSGGRPAQAVVSSSASFRLTLDSIGESIAGHALASASYGLDGGVAGELRPPGEVIDLDVLGDLQTLTWSWEPASTAYNLYRGPLTPMPGQYGVCAASRVAGASYGDSFMPAPGTGVFYLVTGENRLRQEGTKGYASAGAERGNPSPCP